MATQARIDEAIERVKVWQQRSDAQDVDTKVARELWKSSERGEAEYQARLDYEGAKAKQEYAAGELLSAGYRLALLSLENNLDG